MFSLAAGFFQNTVLTVVYGVYGGQGQSKRRIPLINSGVRLFLFLWEMDYASFSICPLKIPIGAGAAGHSRLAARGNDSNTWRFLRFPCRNACKSYNPAFLCANFGTAQLFLATCFYPIIPHCLLLLIASRRV